MYNQKLFNNQTYLNYINSSKYPFIADLSNYILLTKLEFRGSPYSKYTLSLFMVVLYYYFLANEKEYIIDQH